MQETCQRHGISMRPLGYYRDILTVLGENAELLLATHEGELLAGILIAKFNGEAIYLYGASTSQKRNLMPSYLLQWETMRRAKAHGLLRYDLWAVPPELATQAERVDSGMSGANDLPVARQDAAQGLWGVYRFKRGFGGRLVAYCGAYDYVYNLPSYTLWQRLAPPLIDLLGRARTQSTVLLSRLLRR
jgi:lipid II:glycine glycyltransferase (peptidoglycan interpeptide bridge formation enzyme)